MMDPLHSAAGWLLRGAGALRRKAYSAGLLRTMELSVPVISVGALTLGGSGKTPVTRLLARTLTDRGLTVGVVNSAYGGALRSSVHPVDLGCQSLASAVRASGDEAVMLARWLPDALVVCGRDRLGAARRAVDLGAQVVLLDDGFQHRRVARQLDILMVDDAADVSLLMREPASAARHAQLRWRHQRDGRTRDPGSGAIEIESRNVAVSLLGPRGEQTADAATLAGQRVYVLAGIARPAAFARLVKDLGANVVGQQFVGDHSPLRPRHLRRAARLRPDLLLCTEKDLVRMSGDAVVRELWGLTCEVRLARGQQLLDCALKQIC